MKRLVPNRSNHAAPSLATGSRLRLSIVAVMLALPLAAFATTWTVSSGSTQAQIQSIINGSSSGDTISFDGSGTYVLSSPLLMRNGITIEGNGCTWDASAQNAIVRAVNDTSSLSNFTIQDINTINIELYFSGTAGTNVAVNNIIFQDGKSTSSDDKFIQMLHTTSSAVSGCTFLRESSYLGRAVSLYLTNNVTVTGCMFGSAVGDGSDAETYGWFICAINVNNSASNGGFAYATTITANAAYRSLSAPQLEPNCDHAFYLLGFDGLYVGGNTIQGWPAAAEGGIKVRQGQNATIEYNTLNNTGVLLYIYNNNPVQVLQDIVIRNNTITMDSYAADLYHGIGFWRDFSTNNTAEYSININNNNITNGRIQANQADLHVDDFNANGGGVFNNTITNGSIALTSGVNQSGNILQ